MQGGCLLVLYSSFSVVADLLTNHASPTFPAMIGFFFSSFLFANFSNLVASCLFSVSFSRILHAGITSASYPVFSSLLFVAVCNFLNFIPCSLLFDCTFEVFLLWYGALDQAIMLLLIYVCIVLNLQVDHTW